ncbi:hypothetical protein [Pragia fontium]|uniref:hypothetical protein n=1 Tax=Pragia fontium TaxID=82985 RepID=UPI000F6EF662|nr:hypothetical protein [Pragia fontium]VEJ54647.1 Uncharacterised protein [Pragia fontium]
MKGFGILILITGLIAAIASLSMDVSVVTGYGNRVNNLGLMAQRQNFILISCFAVFCGLLMVIFSKKKTSDNNNYIKCSFCAEEILPEAIKCKHCGSDVKKESIELDNTMDSSEIIDFDCNKLVIKKKVGFMIDDESVMELADLLKSKSKHVDKHHLYNMFEKNILEIKLRLPDEIHETFMRRIKYWIEM